MSIDILPCPATARRDVLRVLYTCSFGVVRLEQLNALLLESESGGLDCSGLWGAWQGDRLRGALMTQRLAGACAGLWPPGVTRGPERGRIAALLIARALESLQREGTRVVQSLVDTDSPRTARADLERGGLRYTTDLIFFEREAGLPVHVPADPARLQWRGYDPQTASEFQDVLIHTYVNTLDIPELGGTRRIEDILATHRAAGEFDARLWQVGRASGEERVGAVILLAPRHKQRVVGISYLGVTPQGRGRGLGREALARAIALAAPLCDRIDLAVDARNTPALRLYRRFGFRPVGRRGLYLRILDS